MTVKSDLGVQHENSGAEIHRRAFVNVYRHIPSQRKNKCKKSEWLSKEAFQIAEKIREVKGKGERERCTEWNANFQRIAKRDKNVFISEHCKI